MGARMYEIRDDAAMMYAVREEMSHVLSKGIALKDMADALFTKEVYLKNILTGRTKTIHPDTLENLLYNGCLVRIDYLLRLPGRMRLEYHQDYTHLVYEVVEHYCIHEQEAGHGWPTYKRMSELSGVSSSVLAQICLHKGHGPYVPTFKTTCKIINALTDGGNMVVRITPFSEI